MHAYYSGNYTPNFHIQEKNKQKYEPKKGYAVPNCPVLWFHWFENCTKKLRPCTHGAVLEIRFTHGFVSLMEKMLLKCLKTAEYTAK